MNRQAINESIVALHEKVQTNPDEIITIIKPWWPLIRLGLKMVKLLTNEQTDEIINEIIMLIDEALESQS